MASETTRVAESLFAVADLASMRPLSGAGFMHSLDQQYRFDRRRAHLESTHCVRWWTIRALRWIKSRLQSGHSHSHGLPRRRHIISSSRSVVGAKSNQRDTPFVGMDALVADQVALASERFGAPFESTIERPADEAMLVNKMVEVHRGVGAEYWCLGKTLSSGLRERDGEKRAGGRGGGGESISMVACYTRGGESRVVRPPGHNRDPPQAQEHADTDAKQERTCATREKEVERTDLQKGLGGNDTDIRTDECYADCGQRFATRTERRTAVEQKQTRQPVPGSREQQQRDRESKRGDIQRSVE